VRSERSVVLSRRALFLSGAAVAVSFAPRVARGQVVAQFAGTTPLQRLYVEKIAYSDVPSYVAYVEALLAGGQSLRATFKSKVAELEALSGAERAARLSAAVTQGLFFDCSLSIAGTPKTSPEELSDSLVARSGVALALGRGLEPIFAIGTGDDRGSQLLTRVTQLIQGSTATDFRPFLTGASTVLATLVDAAPQDGVLGLLSKGTSALRGLSGNAAGLAELTGNLKDLSAQLGTFTDSLSKAQVPDVSALKGAVSAVGSLLHVPAQTVKKINKVLDTASAVMTGAVAGAAFGGVGAVVGGAVGLLASLFNNSEPQRDPTLDALTVIDQKLDVIRGDISALGTQIVGLQDAVVRGFQAMGQSLDAIQRTLRELQDRSTTQYAQLLRAIVAVNQGTLVSTFDELHARILLDDEAYRLSLVDPSTAAPSPAPIMLAYSAVSAQLVNSGIGFAHPGRIGFDTMGTIVDKVAQSTSALPLGAYFEYAKILTGVGFSFAATVRPQIAATVLLSALQHSEYTGQSTEVLGLQSTQLGGAIAEIQSLTLTCLEGLDKSPEWTRITVEERHIQAGDVGLGGWKPLRGVPPLLPADFAWLSTRLLDSASQSTHTEVVSSLLARMLPMLRERVAVQALLSDPCATQALLYARRRLAADYQHEAALLMSNPLLQAINVLRRVMRTSLSASLTYGVRHNTDRITSETEASQRIVQRLPQDAPLLAPSGAKFSGTWPEIAEVQRAIVEFFSLPEAVRSQPLSLGPFAANASFILGRQLAVAHAREWPNVTLVDRLKGLARQGIALATLELVIQTRLNALGAEQPKFRSFSSALDEYTRLFLRALGEVIPSGYADDVVRASVLVRSLLDCPGVAVTVPAAFPNARGETLPFPYEVGQLWGWGADALSADAADDSSLGQALVQPECFMAVRNDGALRGAANYMSLCALERDLRIGPEVIKRIQSGPLRGGLRQYLQQLVPP